MKKIVIFLVIISCVVPFISRSANLQNPLKYESIEELVEAIINFVFNLALVIAPLIIIIGGFYIITSSGNPEKIKTGKNIIIYALVGILIILVSKGVVAIITSFISSTPSSPSIPPSGGGGGAF